MNKIILLIVAIIIIGGIWYVNKNPELANLPKNEKADDTSIQVPATGHEDVDEMIVIEEGEKGATNPESLDLSGVEVRVFDLTGKNFEFSQTEIRVAKGDRVRINFKSTSGLHDWVVDEFEANTERVQAGIETSVEFIATETGTFEYYCSVGSHRQLGMIGNLIVE